MIILSSFMMRVTPIMMTHLPDQEFGATFRVTRYDSTCTDYYLTPFKTDNHMFELLNAILSSYGPFETNLEFNEYVIQWSRIVSEYKCIRKQCLNIRSNNSKYCDQCDQILTFMIGIDSQTSPIRLIDSHVIKSIITFHKDP